MGESESVPALPSRVPGGRELTLQASVLTPQRPLLWKPGLRGGWAGCGGWRLLNRPRNVLSSWGDPASSELAHRSPQGTSCVLGRPPPHWPPVPLGR